VICVRCPAKLAKGVRLGVLLGKSYQHTVNKRKTLRKVQTSVKQLIINVLVGITTELWKQKKAVDTAYSDPPGEK
jgi:hypothetical protein